MEIVIENSSESATSSVTATATAVSPSLPTDTSLRLSHPCGAYGTETFSLPAYVADYYTAPSYQQRPVTPTDINLDGASTTVRRVNKSGLLEVSDADSSVGCRSLLRPTETVGHSGTLSRRVDRSGLLEAVPEVPDQIHRNAEDSSTNNTSSTDKRVSVELTEEPRAISTSPRLSETSIPYDLSCSINARRRPFVEPTGFSNEFIGQTRFCSDMVTMTDGQRNRLLGFPDVTDSTTSSLSPSHRLLSPRRIQGCIKSSVTPITSPLPNIRAENRHTVQFVPNETCSTDYTQTSCVTPISVDYSDSERQSSGARIYSSSPSVMTRLHSTSSPAEQSSTKHADRMSGISPNLRTDGFSSLSMTTIKAGSSTESKEGQDQLVIERDKTELELPEGERAEAEGCEHSASDGLEEGRVSFKASNEFLCNDNVQTLRVIILSEQL